MWIKKCSLSINKRIRPRLLRLALFTTAVVVQAGWPHGLSAYFRNGLNPRLWILCCVLG